MQGPKRGAEPPSRHTVPSRGSCEMGPSPLWVLGASSKVVFLHFEAPGLHFGQVLANLAFCYSSFKKGICCLKG